MMLETTLLQGVIPGSMIPTIEGAAAWLATYALHSTLLLGTVWLLVRVGAVRSPSWQDTLWKSALVGGIVTASFQLATGSGVSAFEIHVGNERATETSGLPRLLETVHEQADVAAHSSVDELGEEDRDAIDVGTRADSPRIDRLRDASDRASRFGLLAPERDARRTVVELPVDTDAEVGEDTASSTLTAMSESDTDTSIAPVQPGWRRARSAGVAAWALIACIAVAGLVRLRLALPRRLGARRDIEDPSLVATLEELQRRAGFERPRVRLTQSSGLRGPVAVGWSEICLPERALRELNSAQLESMLAHELAHVVRRDPAWLMIGAIVERLFFFQPLNRIGRHRMQENAEYLCDDWAVEHTGRRVTLAKCLAQVAGWIDRPTRPALLAGMADSGPSTLVRRVTRLLERPASHRALPRPLRGLLAAGCLALVVLAGPGVSAVVATPCPPENEEACEGATADAPKPSLTGMILQDADAREPLKLGINAEPIDTALAVHFGLEPDTALTITAVAPGGAAQRAGLRVHDMIVRIDGRHPVTIDSLRERIAGKRSGDTLRLRILRRGEERTVEAVLGEATDRRMRDRASRRAVADREERADRADRRERVIRERVDRRERADSADRIERRERSDQGDRRRRSSSRDRADVSDEVQNRIADLDSQLQDALAEIDVEIEEVLMPHLELLDEQLAEFGPELEDLGPQIERAIAEHLEKIEQAKPQISAMVDRLEGLDEEEIEEFVEEIEEVIEEVIEPEMENIESLVEEFVEPRIERIEETIERRIEPEIDGLEHLIESIVDREVDKIERLIEEHAGNHEALLEHLHEDVIEPRLEHVHEIVETIVEPRVEHFHELIEAIVEPELESVHEHLEHALHPILEDLHEQIGHALERAHERRGHRNERDDELDLDFDFDIDHEIEEHLDVEVEVDVDTPTHDKSATKSRSKTKTKSKPKSDPSDESDTPAKKKPAKKGVELIAKAEAQPIGQ